MRYCLDTSAIITWLKKAELKAVFEQKYLKAENELLISVVTLGELEALAQKNTWGVPRVEKVRAFTENLIKIDISKQDIIKAYGFVDAFSQGRLKHRPLPQGMTARNMGKNDLWIAATAHVTSSIILTTDHDFDHLHEAEILRVEKLAMNPSM